MDSYSSAFYLCFVCELWVSLQSFMVNYHIIQWSLQVKKHWPKDTHDAQKLLNKKRFHMYLDSKLHFYRSQAPVLHCNPAHR